MEQVKDRYIQFMRKNLRREDAKIVILVFRGFKNITAINPKGGCSAQTLMNDS